MKNSTFRIIFLISFCLLLAMFLALPRCALKQYQVTLKDAATAGLEQKLPIDPKVTVGELDNGLRYYIRENHKPENRAELRLVVNAGSIVEDDDQQGLAHFVEHMAFNGTKNFAKQELVDYLESIGMRFGPDLNAFTNFDETVYLLMVPMDRAEVLNTAFQILEDWAHNLTFDHEEIDKERGVVIEEWRLGRGAGARMRDKQFPILFKDSRYAERLPIGKKEIIESFDYEVLKRFYRDWYRPDLMAVIAVGDFDKSQIEALIKKQFGDIPMVSKPRLRVLYEVPDHEETLFAIATDKEATGTSVAIYYKQPLRDKSTVGAHRQKIVERLYNGMLNRRLSELTQQSDPPLLGGSSSQGLFIRSKEVYVLSAEVKDVGIERGLEAILIEAERVARHGFTASEFERQKRSVYRSVEQECVEKDKSNSSTFAEDYIRSFLYGEPIPSIEYELELCKRFIPEISLDEVNRLAKEWITNQSRVVLVNAPEKEDLRVPTEAELLAVFETVHDKDITSYDDTVTDQPLVEYEPEFGDIVEERTIEEVGVTEWELSNGVRVVLKPTDFKEDQILMEALSPGGTSLSSDEDYVPASTATQVIASGGLGAFSAIELQKKLAGKVVSVSPTISDLEEGLSGSASSKDVETMFQIIYLMFTSPRADETIFNSLQTRIKAIVKNRSASPMAAFQDTLQNTLTQYHYRSRPLTLGLLDEMNLEKSYAFYKDRFADAGDFTFVFVGNLDLEKVKPLVRRYLGGLLSIGRKESWRDVGIDYPEGIIRKTVRKGVEPQSRTVIVFTGSFKYTRENIYAMRSMTEVLDIKLREKLREELGGTYGVSVSYSVSRIPDQEYNIMIGFGSDPERVEELTEVVFREIEALKIAGASEEYLNKVMETQRRSRETSLKQNEYWLSQLVAQYRRGADPREILTYEELIDRLDSTMVQEAAKMYCNANNYVQVSLYPEAGK